jgi:hypothetical protein
MHSLRLTLSSTFPDDCLLSMLLLTCNSVATREPTSALKAAVGLSSGPTSFVVKKRLAETLVETGSQLIDHSTVLLQPAVVGLYRAVPYGRDILSIIMLVACGIEVGLCGSQLLGIGLVLIHILLTLFRDL